MKRNISAILSAMVLVTGLLSPVVGSTTFAANSIPDSPANVMKAFTDVSSDHWAVRPLQRWSGNGVINGYEDGSFRPAKVVTKAEFAAIMNRIFNYQEQSAVLPVDVQESAWYKSDIAKGIAAGYISKDTVNKIYPTQPLTRGEVVLSLQKVFHLKANNTAVSFKDLSGVNAETLSAIAALTAGGYIKGYPGGMFKPDGVVTRAELASMVDRMISELVVTAGEGSLGTVKGNVIINRADVTLKDTVIEGNLYLTQGIGEGNALLSQIKVKGTTFISGGGEQSVGFKDSAMGETQVSKSNGKVRVYASGTTVFDAVYVQSGAMLEESSLTGAGFTNVYVTAGPKTVKLKGDFAAVTTTDSTESGLTLTISGGLGKLTLNSPTTLVLNDKVQLNVLHIAPNAKGSILQGSAIINTLENNAVGVTLGGSALPKGNTTQVTVSSTVPPVTSGGGSGGGTPTVNPWTLVWNDEFNDETIDPTKWTYDLGDGTVVGNPGWGNNELQWYTNEEKNVKEKDGKLIITALKEEQGGKPYTSSRIKTKGLFSKTYGKFEIRAKAPTGKGYWPAIWMLPENTVYGQWASSGEIDIMEGWGSRPNTVAGTIHYGAQWPDNIYSGKEYVFPGNSTIEEFHTYALEWEPGEMRWYVDGVLFSTKNDWYSLSNGQPANNAYPAPFNQEFHLLMNLAVGGNFDGNPTSETVFPKSMEIDYVRVYDLTGREYRQPVPVTTAKEAYLAGSKTALPDGNLVYNNNFTEQVDGDAGMGIPKTAYWSLFKESGANATLSLEPIGGKNFVKVNISNAGGNSYSIQPQAIVSLAKGRFYKLSFEAKTDTSRNINVRVTGGESRGFAGYSPGLKAELTSTMKPYEIMFQMKEDSDIAARVEFNLGTNASPVWIGNVRLEEIDSIPFEHDTAKTPLGSGNHLYNGTFDLGGTNRLSYWHAEAANGAAVSPVVNAQGTLDLQVTQAGSNTGDVKLLQKGIYLIEGQDYELTFKGASTSNRMAKVKLLGKDSSVYAEQVVNLTPVNQEIKVNFPDLAGGTDHEGQFVLELGGATGTISLDNFNLIRTSFYYDPSLVYFPLLNGEFNFGFDAWERLLTEQGGQSTAAVSDGKAKFSITNTGNQSYSVMLFQNKLKATSGIDYVIKFDASSSTARKIQVIADNASYQPSFSKVIDVTPESKSFTFEFRQGSNDTLALKFLLGKVEGVSVAGSHEITIDNVRFEIKNAPSKPQELLKDKSNNRVSQPIELIFTDNEAWRNAISAVKVNGTRLEASKYTIEPGKITIAASAFPIEGLYTITVEADYYVSGTVVQTILANDTNLVLNSSFGIGQTGWSKWSGEGGSSTFTVNDGVAEVAIAAAGGEPWHTQLFQEDIQLEAGKTYELSFKAKSTVARQIIVEYSNTTAASNPVKFDVTATWATYSTQFTVTNNNTLKLNYLIGKTMGTDVTANGVPHTISFDDITITEVVVGTPPTIIVTMPPVITPVILPTGTLNDAVVARDTVTIE
ncbi:carbohydrate binding domain-containing protein [Paenibacillus wynnii]|uniref:carbohydrate binding domain-containing protein n=1 Tax=Paenibacillus wynnii TaxID=268407 RepID=UPI0006903BE4|nr:carbohydrate binding domain-containing protein [Paenibacillus wynnii]